MYSIAEAFSFARTPVKMRLRNASEKHKIVFCYALRLLEEFNLSSRYGFCYNHCKYTLGRCHMAMGRRRGVISLSADFVTNNSYEIITDILLHEIAHALVGGRHGHDKVWQKKALELGATPDAKVDSVLPPANYMAKCSSCLHRHYTYRKLKNRPCKKCGQVVRYIEC